MRKNLNSARISAKKTQREMSKILGISEVYYRKIEAGERTGSVRLWDNLEKLFKIPQQILRVDSMRIPKTNKKTS